MLSRVADSLYWMSRYLERAEHSARVIDVQLNLMLDPSALSAEDRSKHVCRCLGAAFPDKPEADAHTLTYGLVFDYTSRSSIVSCIMAARENARQVREQVSSEMWEQLNRLYHETKRIATTEATDAPLEFLFAVRESAHLFQGVTDSTMSHGEGWQFIQIGRFIERATAISTLLDVHFSASARGGNGDTPQTEHFEWIGLLKGCTAFEAFCKVYTADLSPTRIAEFLLLNPEFPHSIRFSIDRLYEALTAIAAASPARRPDPVDRLTGRLRSSLSYTPIEEVLGPNFHAYLEDIQRQCNQIHSAVHRVYISYPIQSTIDA